MNRTHNTLAVRWHCKPLHSAAVNTTVDFFSQESRTVDAKWNSCSTAENLL